MLVFYKEKPLGHVRACNPLSQDLKHGSCIIGMLGLGIDFNKGKFQKHTKGVWLQFLQPQQ